MPAKKPLSDSQEEYISFIKTSLEAARVSMGYEYRELLKIIKTTYDFDLNRNTFRRQFDPEDKSLDLSCIVTAAKVLNLDLNELLKPMPLRFNEDPALRGNVSPNSILQNVRATLTKTRNPAAADAVDTFIQSVADVKDKFEVLYNDGYTGVFKGFIFSPTKPERLQRTRPETLCHFDLKMQKDGAGVMYATVERKKVSKHPENEQNFVYKGIPIYSRAYRTVIMFLTDESQRGEFYFLSFGFQQYRSEQGLVFRKGLAVTGEAFDKSTMVVQNFIIFDQKLSKENMRFVRGLLKAPSLDFCIEVSEVEKLAEKHPEVKELLTQLPDALQRRKREMYVLNEENILTLEKSTLPESVRMKALLLLKARATIDGKYYYAADGVYSAFAKNYFADEEPYDEEF